MAKKKLTSVGQVMADRVDALGQLLLHLDIGNATGRNPTEHRAGHEIMLESTSPGNMV
jgi:hypothetical protein